jgi:hypothetical protein
LDDWRLKRRTVGLAVTRSNPVPMRKPVSVRITERGRRRRLESAKLKCPVAYVERDGRRNAVVAMGLVEASVFALNRLGELKSQCSIPSKCAVTSLRPFRPSGHVVAEWRIMS